MPCAHCHGCSTVAIRRCGDDLSEVWRRRRPAALGGLAFLAAVSGALQSLLRRRGEVLGEFRVAVMVGGRGTASAGGPGNRAVPLVVSVSAAGEPESGWRGSRVILVGASCGRRAPASRRAGAVVPCGRIRRAVPAVSAPPASDAHSCQQCARPRPAVYLRGAPVAAIVPVAVGETGNLSVTFSPCPTRGP